MNFGLGGGSGTCGFVAFAGVVALAVVLMAATVDVEPVVLFGVHLNDCYIIMGQLSFRGGGRGKGLSLFLDGKGYWYGLG